MRLINCSDKTFQAKGNGRSPISFGQGEHTFPARTVILPPKEIVEVTDRDGEIILENIGGQGILQVMGQEPLEETIRRGRRLRYETLRKGLVYYRHVQAQKAAQGLPVDLMSEEIRASAIEMLKLKKELGTDPLVAEAMEGLGTVPMEDPLKDELAAIGMPLTTTPMQPKVPDLLSGVEGVG